MTDTIVTADRLREMLLWLERCPTCHCNWLITKPANIHGTDLIRCIECKATYDSPDTMRQIITLALEALALHGVPHFDRTRCATEGCGKVATEYFERGGVGSYHCADCSAKIEALAAERLLAEAREALKPFANWPMERGRRDEEIYLGSTVGNVTFGDFERARATLSPGGSNGQG